MNGNKEYIQKYDYQIKQILIRQPKLRGYYAYLASNHSITTSVNYLKKIENFIIYADKPMKLLRMDDFSEYMLICSKTHNGDQTTASFQINIYHALKSFCNYLYYSDIIPKNYMEILKRPKPIEAQKTIKKRENGFLTQDEIKIFLNNIYISDSKWKNRDLLISLIYFNTGIRRSALYKLDIDSIDWNSQTLIVTDKEGKVMKHVISDTTWYYLQLWIKERQLILGNQNINALFISAKKNRMSDQAIYYVIKKYGKCISNKNISPHKLRATYGTQLYNQTGDIHFVQKAMGHSTPAVTQLYVRGNNNTAERAADIMENLLQTH